jgi:hypothetical protein
MTNWKYQFRAFVTEDPTMLRESLRASGLPKREQEVTDTYVIGTTDVSARVRDGQVKIKGPKTHVDTIVDEVLDERHYLPMNSDLVSNAIGTRCDGTQLKSASDLTDYASRRKDTLVTPVKKNSTKYEGTNLEVEVTKANILGSDVHTVCVASNDVKTLHDALHRYGVLAIPGSEVMDYAEAIRKASI